MASDPTLGHIHALDPRIQQHAWLLVYAARVAGYPVTITSSVRSTSQQRQLVSEGRSRTLKSKHLDGLAFDIDWWRWSRDDVPTEFWYLIGPWAERNLGLKWGGRFATIRDFGHFEL